MSGNYTTAVGALSTPAHACKLSNCHFNYSTVCYVHNGDGNRPVYVIAIFSRSEFGQQCSVARCLESGESVRSCISYTCCSTLLLRIKTRLRLGNACYFALNKLLDSRLLSREEQITIYNTVISPTMLYGRETQPLTRQGESKLRIIENRVLRKIFGPKRDDRNQDWRRQYSQKVQELYKSRSSGVVKKSQRLRGAGHVAQTSVPRRAFTVYIGKLKRKGL